MLEIGLEWKFVQTLAHVEIEAQNTVAQAQKIIWDVVVDARSSLSQRNEEKIDHKFYSCLTNLFYQNFKKNDFLKSHIRVKNFLKNLLYSFEWKKYDIKDQLSSQNWLGFNTFHSLDFDPSVLPQLFLILHFLVDILKSLKLHSHIMTRLATRLPVHLLPLKIIRWELKCKNPFFEFFVEKLFFGQLLIMKNALSLDQISVIWILFDHVIGIHVSDLAKNIFGLLYTLQFTQNTLVNIITFDLLQSH